jgi:hypothetical protein
MIVYADWITFYTQETNKFLHKKKLRHHFFLTTSRNAPGSNGWRGCDRGGATESKRLDIGGVAAYWQLLGIEIEIADFVAGVIATDAAWGFAESSFASHCLSGYLQK